MAWIRLSERAPGRPADESGIALFMVIAAMTILSVIVTEFTYVAQVNARATVDSSDQIKAHYLAKTGFKLSLLRLRAYKELKAFGGAGSNLPSIPKAILDQVWSFPFFYPIPGDVPGLTVAAKDEISKFQEDSTLPGKFSATIISESNRVSLNSMLPAMAPVPIPSPTATPRSRGDNNPTPRTSPSPAPKYDPEEARKGIHDMIAQIIEDKSKADPDWANEYRDLNVDELFDNIVGWIDFSYQPKNASGKQAFYKRSPFYSLSELHMIYPVDDGLYDVLAPNFTAFNVSGINVNTVEEPMLRALLPGISDEEVKKFFEDRDNVEVDGKFKASDDFFAWVEKNVAAYKSSTTLDDLKIRLKKQGIQILVDEQIFKITVVAEVNKATRILEAWVVIDPDADKSKKGGPPAPGPGGFSGASPDSTDGSAPANAAGLRLLYMRES